jgi:hypothetical protein
MYNLGRSTMESHGDAFTRSDSDCIGYKAQETAPSSFASSILLDEARAHV